MKTRWLFILLVLAVASCTSPPVASPTTAPNLAATATSVPAATQSPSSAIATPSPSSQTATITSSSEEPRAIASPTPQTPAPTSLPPTRPSTTSGNGSATSPTPLPAPSDPFDLISQESLLATIQDLTNIQPYSGWRNSASQGEREALDYVSGRLSEMAYLDALGLELERQTFHVFLGMDLWETGLHLTRGGQEVEVPADGLRGPRDDVVQALTFDSDGVLNDAQRNPVQVEGAVVPVRSMQALNALTPADVADKILLVDYALLDRALLGTERAAAVAERVVRTEPAGVVLVTQFSNEIGESHGAFVGDVSAFNYVVLEPAFPLLYARLEDLTAAGIHNWDDLAQIEAARLTWDADVFSPADSGNLVARIPGADSAQAIILGAHIDSPNGPGALDDGSGSAVLLEIARVLDEAQTQPPIDLYLVWFGSEELGLYGAGHFASTHQELLDRTLGMLQIDCLTRPLNGISADLNLVTWSYVRLGDDRLLWPDYLAQQAAGRGVETVPRDALHAYSDNNVLGGFNVPHADLIYENVERMEALGSVHYAAHIHDPYDTLALVRDVSDVLEQMTRVALAAALDTAQDAPDLRVPPPPAHRVLFVASHTEVVQMSPSSFTEMGMALALEGFDVDLIPYGQALTPADLADTDMVILLPVVDYPTQEGDPDLYDEAWHPQETAALQAYVEQGGLLVLTNSAHRLKHGRQVLDSNEDWPDVNPVAERFGITYFEGALPNQARTVVEHPLLQDVSVLSLSSENGVPFEIKEGQILAQAGAEPAVALAAYGTQGGEVLALADVGLLGADWIKPVNLAFWRNLARYSSSR